jgi:hypothetical protein
VQREFEHARHEARRVAEPARWKTQRHRNPIVKALDEGKTLKDLVLADRRRPYASRLAMLMTEAGPKNEFFASRATIRRKTNPVDDAEIEAGFRTIEKHWKLFEYDAEARKGQGCWRPRPLPAPPKPSRSARIIKAKKETPAQFRARVLRTVDAELAVLWIMADITKPGGGPAPHSYANFAGEIGRTMPTVWKCIRSIVENGYIVGFARGAQRPTLWVLPDNDHPIYNLDNRYNRVGTHPRDRQPLVDLRAQRRDHRGI